LSRSPEPDLAALQADSRVLWNEDVLRFCDTDANGHVNNAAFAMFCESGRVNALTSVLGPTLGPDTFFAIARLVIEYRAELHYPGRVRCGTWISRLGSSSVSFSQVLLGPDGRLAATSDAVTVLMDGESRRPKPLPAATRTDVEALLRPE
jgi:acyl-CoA thioester hydrolase